ncbi:MAG: UvrD-helicase domain-containing protein [Candidatus Aminicenantales bacterium]
MAVVLINDTVKRFLLGRPPAFRERIRRKFEFLEWGLWEGNLRTKKLRGLSSKCVFEVAADADLRVLFTLGRSADRPSGDLIIYVWGIATHDRLDRQFRQVIPANVPFLRFEDYEEAMFSDVCLEDLEPSCITQESITEKTQDESGSQRWYPVEEPEWRRIRSYTAEELELFLCLTPEQKDVLESPPPVLVSGTAGSGKTTLAVYYLLRGDLRARKNAFISFNRHLKLLAERLYRGLLNEAEGRSRVVVPDFWVFKDLLLDTASRAGRPFDPAKEVDFRRFRELYSSHPLYQKFDPVLVWEEIRSILKGALPQVDTTVLERALRALRNREPESSIFSRLQQQFLLYADLESLKAVPGYVRKYLQTDISSFCARMFRYVTDDAWRGRLLALLERTLEEILKRKELAHKRHLSFLEYEFLGKKKAPNFQFSRREIYPVIEWYEHRLKSDGMWDELDLSREVLNIVSAREGLIPAYDLVACDEIQDFTDIQIGLLLALVRDPRHVFFAGDTKQTVNPTGFRWEEVRRHYFERGLEVPAMKRLSLNFRSSGSIVELSNVLLELKEKYLGIRAEEGREEWRYKGRPVAVATGISEPEMLDLLRTAGAGRTILVRSEGEKSRLQRELGTELVFTINEAKGLEFETVVLWKFCESGRPEDVWASLLDLSQKKVHEAWIRHEINLLYVGITRSQRDLIVYDGTAPAPIWGSEEFKSRVYATSDRSYVHGIWNVLSTPAEWVEQGHYFFERDFYRAAAECYKNGGDQGLFAKASAYEAEKAGRYGEAARYFDSLGDRERAAPNYERAGEFEQALPLWEALGNRERAFHCRVEVLKREGRYAEAGRLYLARKSYPDALACFHKAGDFAAMAGIYLRPLNKIREAAACYEQASNPLAAAKLYRRLKSYDKAAELFFRGGDFRSAESLWKRTGRSGQLLALYEQTGQQEKLLAVYEAQGNLDKAVKVLRGLKDKDAVRLGREAASLFARRKYFRALVRFTVLEDHGRTAECHLRLKHADEAIRHFKLAGDFQAAGTIYQGLKDYRRAAECFLLSSTDEEKGFPMARQAARKAKDAQWTYVQARRLVEAGSYAGALALFSIQRFTPPEIGLCLLRMNDEAGALEAWGRITHYRDYCRLIDICLSQNAVAEGGRFFLEKMRLGLQKGLMGIPYELIGIKLVDFMDAYFAGVQDPMEMRTWGTFLARFDFEATFWKKSLSYLERRGDPGALIDFVRRLDLFNKSAFLEIKKRWKKEIPGLEERQDWDGLALRDYFLEGGRRIPELLRRMTVGAGNFVFFLLGEDQHFEAAVDWCDRNGRLPDAWERCAKGKRYDRAALVCERAGRPEKAAEFYASARQPEKAASIYAGLGRFDKAGDVFYKSGEYAAALALYAEQQPPDKKRLARTREKMGDFAAALNLWKEAGDKKASEKCRARWERSRQGGLFDHLKSGR